MTDPLQNVESIVSVTEKLPVSERFASKNIGQKLQTRTMLQHMLRIVDAFEHTNNFCLNLYNS